MISEDGPERRRRRGRLRPDHGRDPRSKAQAAIDAITAPVADRSAGGLARTRRCGSPTGSPRPDLTGQAHLMTEHAAERAGPEAPPRSRGDRIFARSGHRRRRRHPRDARRRRHLPHLRGHPGLHRQPRTRSPAAPATSSAYVWPLVFGTLLASALALLIAAPLAIGVALFISHYAPRRLAVPLGYLVDLLAAVPSIVYGLWGIFFLAPRMVPLYVWLDDHLGFIPFFAGPASSPAARSSPSASCSR